MKGSSVSKFA